MWAFKAYLLTHPSSNLITDGGGSPQSGARGPCDLSSQKGKRFRLEKDKSRRPLCGTLTRSTRGLTTSFRTSPSGPPAHHPARGDANASCQMELLALTGLTGALAGGQTPLEGMFGTSPRALLKMHSYLFTAAPGLCCSLQAFSRCSEEGLPPAGGGVWASYQGVSLVAEHKL